MPNRPSSGKHIFAMAGIQTQNNLSPVWTKNAETKKKIKEENEK